MTATCQRTHFLEAKWISTPWDVSAIVLAHAGCRCCASAAAAILYACTAQRLVKPQHAQLADIALPHARADVELSLVMSFSRMRALLQVGFAACANVLPRIIVSSACRPNNNT